MKNHLYLTCSHSEALIASQLEPADFGTYMAVGTEKLTLGQLMFFEINPDLKSDYFDLARARKECVPHPDGRPKASLYISIYRAMEHVGAAGLRHALPGHARRPRHGNRGAGDMPGRTRRRRRTCTRNCAPSAR